MHELNENSAPAAFPSISPVDVALGNCLAAKAPSFVAKIMGEERRLALRLSAAAREFDVSVECSIGECQARISISDEEGRLLLPGLAADLALRDLPAALVMAVATTALRPVVAGFAAHLGQPYSLGALCNDDASQNALPQTAGRGWPLLTITEAGDGQENWLGALELDPNGVHEFVTLLAADQLLTPWSGAEEVCVKADAQFWSTEMSLKSIADLHCGDVLLAPQGYPADCAALILRGERRWLGAGRRNGTSIIIDDVKGTANG